jgi:hypothetical protein
VFAALAAGVVLGAPGLNLTRARLNPKVQLEERISSIPESDEMDR